MNVLVAGASGATGIQLVKELLKRDVHVKIIVRDVEKLPEEVRVHRNLSILQAGILNLKQDEIREYIKDCDAVTSCLGHNISLKGIFGKPKKLVSDSVKMLCCAVQANTPHKPVKFILMNTTANKNKDQNEKRSVMEELVFSLIRIVLPPHPDNEQAADYLRKDVGTNNKFVEWSIVRPDGLINENVVSEYNAYPSPVRSPIFDAGKTSRINVGHFMAELITNDNIWNEWKWKMPVIYNKTNVGVNS